MTISIMNTQVGFVPLTLTTIAADGTVSTVPTPPTDTFSAESSNATSLAASIGPDPSDTTGAGAVGVIHTPMVLQSDPGNSGGGITVTVTDSNGDVTLVLGPYDVTTVPVANNITAGPLSFTTQAAPTAPGP